MSQRCHKRKFEHVCATLLSQDGKPHSLLLQRQYLRCRGFGAVASGAFGEYEGRDATGKITLSELSYHPARHEKQRISAIMGATVSRQSW